MKTPKIATWSSHSSSQDRELKFDLKFEDTSDDAVDMKEWLNTHRYLHLDKMSKSERAVDDAYMDLVKAVNEVQRAYHKFQNTYHIAKDDFKYIKEKSEEFIVPIEQLGIHVLNAVTVKNEYWNNDSYGLLSPWFRITTNVGVFVCGWRKRVRHLEIVELFVESPLLNEGTHFFQEHHHDERQTTCYHIENNTQYSNFFAAFVNRPLKRGPTWSLNK